MTRAQANRLACLIVAKAAQGSIDCAVAHNCPDADAEKIDAAMRQIVARLVERAGVESQHGPIDWESFGTIAVDDFQRR